MQTVRVDHRPVQTAGHRLGGAECQAAPQSTIHQPQVQESLRRNSEQQSTLYLNCQP